MRLSWECGGKNRQIAHRSPERGDIDTRDSATAAEIKRDQLSLYNHSSSTAEGMLARLWIGFSGHRPSPKDEKQNHSSRAAGRKSRATKKPSVRDCPSDPRRASRSVLAQDSDCKIAVCCTLTPCESSLWYSCARGYVTITRDEHVEEHQRSTDTGRDSRDQHQTSYLPATISDTTAVAQQGRKELRRALRRVHIFSCTGYGAALKLGFCVGTLRKVAWRQKAHASQP